MGCSHFCKQSLWSYSTSNKNNLSLSSGSVAPTWSWRESYSTSNKTKFSRYFPLLFRCYSTSNKSLSLVTFRCANMKLTKEKENTDSMLTILVKHWVGRIVVQICRYADMQICTNYVSNFPGSKITHEVELSIHKDSIVAQVCASGHRSTIWQSDKLNYESI